MVKGLPAGTWTETSVLWSVVFTNLVSSAPEALLKITVRVGVGRSESFAGGVMHWHPVKNAKDKNKNVCGLVCIAGLLDKSGSASIHDTPEKPPRSISHRRGARRKK